MCDNISVIVVQECAQQLRHTLLGRCTLIHPITLVLTRFVVMHPNDPEALHNPCWFLCCFRLDGYCFYWSLVANVENRRIALVCIYSIHSETFREHGRRLHLPKRRMDYSAQNGHPAEGFRMKMNNYLDWMWELLQQPSCPGDPPDSYRG